MCMLELYSNDPLTCLSLNLCVCFREKKQKIQDIKNNIKEAIEVSCCVHVIFAIRQKH